MVVASSLDGRVRVRDEGLKKEPLITRVREALLATPGVSGVEANPRVGSLLILYSAALTAVEKILKTVSDLLGSGEEVRGPAQPVQSLGKMPFAGKLSLSIPPRVKSKLVNIGMLASLVLSLAAAVFGLKKLHVLTGIVFVLLFGDHFYQRRAQMFA